MQQSLSPSKRIESIDIIRGLAMVIMALDHVRDYVHVSANTDDPLNLATTSPALYFTGGSPISVHPSLSFCLALLCTCKAFVKAKRNWVFFY